MRWKTLLLLTTLTILYLTGSAYAYIGKFETDTRWHLRTYDTYLYFNQILYVDNPPKLYNDKLTLTNSYMGSSSTVNTVTISVIQGNLTVTTLMENNVFEATATQSTGSLAEFYVQITTLTEPSTVTINDESLDKTERYNDYTDSSTDSWCYTGQGKVYLKGEASSTVTFSIDWTPEDTGNGVTPPPTGYHNLTVYAQYENGTTLDHTPVTLQLAHHSWKTSTDHNGTCLFKNLVEGYYTITILTQTINVNIPFQDKVTFTFPSQQPQPTPDWLTQNWLPLLLITSLAASIIILIKE